MGGIVNAPATNTTARPAPVAARPYAVVIWGAPRREYSRYAAMREAEDACLALRKFGFDAHVENTEGTK